MSGIPELELAKAGKKAGDVIVSTLNKPIIGYRKTRTRRSRTGATTTTTQSSAEVNGWMVLAGVGLGALIMMSKQMGESKGGGLPNPFVGTIFQPAFDFLKLKWSP